MTNFEQRRLIEALRSGVPSRSVGKYFTSSRKAILDRVASDLEDTCLLESNSFIFNAKYGEGKTHLLNTIFSMAQELDMVVSFVPLGKETPPNRMDVLYKRILQETYLPGRSTPGIQSLFSTLSLGSNKVDDLLHFAATRLKTDRLYYVLKAYLSALTTADDDFDILDADLKGSFAPSTKIKNLYLKYCNEKASFNTKFIIKENTIDYFALISHLFKVQGYSGWVILFDEAELIGRFGKSSRLQSYLNLSQFISPPESIENLYSVFAFSSSFSSDVIFGKSEYSIVDTSLKTDEEKDRIKSVLDNIIDSQELKSLTEEELEESLSTIIDVYNEAYNTNLTPYKDKILNAAMNVGYLLRTRIRATIEALDQIYQNGDICEITSKEVDAESFEETLDLFLSE